MLEQTKKGASPMATYEMTVKIEIPEDFGEFQALELKVLEASRQAGRDLLWKIFLDYEVRTIGKRPVQKKDQRGKSFETLLGKICFQRWRVADVFKKKCLYPIDEWIGLKPGQKVSPNLVCEIVEQCVNLPYEKASHVIHKLSGVKKTAMSIWKLIQGESKRRQNKVSAIPDWKIKSLPELKPDSPNICPILGVDPDATYVRPRRRADKKHEMKMAVIYTGRKEQGKAEKKKRNKKKKKMKNKRWELVQKQVVMTVINETADKLFNQVTEKAVIEYGLHAGSRVVVHGDGDPWIKQFHDHYCPQALNRLDPWHVFKKIREATDLEKMPSDWYRDFYTSPSSLIKRVEALGREMADKKDKERIEQLAGYLKNNKEGMNPSGVSQETKKQFPRMYRRGSGPIESNIFQGICQRFKAPRMMWSESGLKNLSFLREEFLNRSFDFKKVVVPKEQYREKTYADELRELVRDL